MLPRAVDAFEGLFVQQQAETVAPRHLAHERHDEHVMVYRQVAFFENGSQLKLVGSHFVMAGLDGYAQFQRLYFKVFHKGSHTGGDGSEVMVLQLLVLAGFVSHQGAPGQQQVGTGGIQSFVYQEVFLFPAQVGHHFLHFRVEVTAHVHGGFAHSTQGFQQWRFVVQRLAGVSNENGRDAQGVVHHEDRR